MYASLSVLGGLQARPASLVLEEVNVRRTTGFGRREVLRHQETRGHTYRSHLDHRSWIRSVPWDGPILLLARKETPATPQQQTVIADH